MGVVERSRRYYSVPLEVPFLSGGQLSAARGGLRLIQAPRLLVDFAKSSGARSDLAVLARAGVASVVPGRAGDGAGAKAGNFHRGEDRPGSGCRSRRQFSCHRKQHRGRPQRADRYAHAQRYDDADLETVTAEVALRRVITASNPAWVWVMLVLCGCCVGCCRGCCMVLWVHGEGRERGV